MRVHTKHKHRTLVLGNGQTLSFTTEGGERAGAQEYGVKKGEASPPRGREDGRATNDQRGQKVR